MSTTAGASGCDYLSASSCVAVCVWLLLACRKLREPAVAKFNDQCQRITEVRWRWRGYVAMDAKELMLVNDVLQEMVCSSCHPFVGTWQMTTVCPRLCSDWCASLATARRRHVVSSLHPTD